MLMVGMPRAARERGCAKDARTNLAVGLRPTRASDVAPRSPSSVCTRSPGAIRSPGARWFAYKPTRLTCVRDQRRLIAYRQDDQREERRA